MQKMEAYSITSLLKSLEVWFVVDNNHVVEASIGHVPLTTSK